jgi:hypothetical protein
VSRDGIQHYLKTIVRLNVQISDHSETLSTILDGIKQAELDINIFYRDLEQVRDLACSALNLQKKFEIHPGKSENRNNRNNHNNHKSPEARGSIFF